jgi:hypothetical protein
MHYNEIYLFQNSPVQPLTSGTTAYVSGVQGECQNSHQKFAKSEKQHRHRILYGTYNPIMVAHKTHGQNIQI